MMVAVVNNGTGGRAAIAGVQVAGKTGTAQHAEGRAPHAWFVGFAPAEAPRVAVAVVVEEGGDVGSEATGGRLAAPIAAQVLQAALGAVR
jgi:penicillin-binding protein A